MEDAKAICSLIGTSIEGHMHISFLATAVHDKSDVLPHSDQVFCFIMRERSGCFPAKGTDLFLEEIVPHTERQV